MAERPVQGSILAAEFRMVDARVLTRCLKSLGLEVYQANTIEQLLERLRHHCFRQAIIAVEFRLAEELLLARVAKLATMERLMAVGPPNNWAMEAAARAAGARAYVSRPVSSEALWLTFRSLRDPSQASVREAAHHRATVRGGACNRRTNGPNPRDPANPD